MVYSMESRCFDCVRTSMDTNVLTLSGYLKRDASVNENEARFVLCVEVWSTDAQVEIMEVMCSLWGKSVQRVAKYLKADRQVVLSGKLRPNGKSFYMAASDLKLYSTKWRGEQQGGYSGSRTPYPATSNYQRNEGMPSDDEMPF